MNTELWKRLVEILIRVWHQQNPGLEMRLQGDRLGAHMDPDTVFKLAQSLIRCIWPPGKSTSITAPLDDKAFASLKLSLTRKAEAEVNLFEGSAGNLNSWITDALPELIVDSITPAVIKSSFAATGAWPWNPELLMKRAQDLADLEVSPPTANETLINAVTHLLTPDKPPPTKMAKRMGVDINRVYTSEQLLARQEEFEKNALALSTQKEKTRLEKEKKKRDFLENAEERGKKKVAKMVARGDAEAAKWLDSGWLDAHTCRACRKVYKSDLNWVCPDCSAFWYCTTCKRAARFKIQAHEENCETCIGEAQKSASSSPQ